MTGSGTKRSQSCVSGALEERVMINALSVTLTTFSMHPNMQRPTEQGMM